MKFSMNEHDVAVCVVQAPHVLFGPNLASGTSPFTSSCKNSVRV